MRRELKNKFTGDGIEAVEQFVPGIGVSLPAPGNQFGLALHKRNLAERESRGEQLTSGEFPGCAHSQADEDQHLDLERARENKAEGKKRFEFRPILAVELAA